jgi:hypothetical protein
MSQTTKNDKNEDGNRKHLFQDENDSEFKFFEIVEDTIWGIIRFFFQFFRALFEMSLRPWYFGRNASFLRQQARIPKPFTFMAFAAIFASIGFRRLIAIFQILFCITSVRTLIRIQDFGVPDWLRDSISDFCKTIPENSFEIQGINNPDLLALSQGIDFGSFLITAIPIAIIVVTVGFVIAYVFKHKDKKELEKVIYIICYAAGYQLIAFSIAAIVFSGQVFTCIDQVRREGEFIGQCLLNPTNQALFSFLLLLWSIIAPGVILFFATINLKPKINGSIRNEFRKIVTISHIIEYHSLRIQKSLFLTRLFEKHWFRKEMRRLILFFLAIFSSPRKALFLILFLILFPILSPALLIVELSSVIITENLGLVRSVGTNIRKADRFICEVEYANLVNNKDLYITTVISGLELKQDRFLNKRETIMVGSFFDHDDSRFGIPIFENANFSVESWEAGDDYILHLEPNSRKWIIWYLSLPKELQEILNSRDVNTVEIKLQMSGLPYTGFPESSVCKAQSLLKVK